jgi:hypothetical protein
VLKRAPIRHLTVDLQGHTDNEIYKVLLNSMPQLTALQSFKLMNFNDSEHARELLRCIDTHCLSVESITLSQDRNIQQQQQQQQQATCCIDNGVCPGSTRSLTLNNVKWTNTLSHKLKVLHLQNSDWQVDIQLSAELEELHLVNSKVLPQLPESLLVSQTTLDYMLCHQN